MAAQAIARKSNIVAPTRSTPTMFLDSRKKVQIGFRERVLDLTSAFRVSEGEREFSKSAPVAAGQQKSLQQPVTAGQHARGFNRKPFGLPTENN